MRLAVISVTYPYGLNEPYLEHELKALASFIGPITVFPLSPAGRTSRPLPERVELYDLPRGASLLTAALRVLLQRPRPALTAFLDLLKSGSGAKAACKNAVVFVRALVIAERLRAIGADHVHAYWLSTPASAAFIAARIAGIPWSASAHRWDIYEANALQVKLDDACFIRTISERGRRDLARSGASAAKIVTVPIGVPIPPLRPARFAPAHELRLLCPAALVPVKGHDTLLRALALLRLAGVALHCTFAGDGPLRADLQRLSAKLRLQDAVTFAGHVPQRALHAAMNEGAYHAIVLASRELPGNVMEGVPAALVEAMGRRIPVIASRSGSIAELVDEQTGCLVAPDDPHALAAAILGLHNDLSSAQARADRAYARVRSRHEAAQQMRKLAVLLHTPLPSLERTSA